MSDFPITPLGYSDEPVVLTHLAVEGYTHPTNSRLRLASCAPVWFCPHGPEVKKAVLCPGCALVGRVCGS